MYGDVIAAGAAQPGRIPGVQNLAFFEAQQTLPGFGYARAVHSRRTVLDDVAPEPHPFAMMAPADERETSAHAIPPRNDTCDARRGRGSSHCGKQIGEHGASDILIEKGTDVAGVAADHCAPPDRGVLHRQRLDDAELVHWIQLGPTPGARHDHAEDAGLLHRRGELRGDTTALLDRLARRPDLRCQTNRRMQDLRVVL